VGQWYVRASGLECEYYRVVAYAHGPDFAVSNGCTQQESVCRVEWMRHADASVSTTVQWSEPMNVKLC
jgi:hypothetical protein